MTKKNIDPEDQERWDELNFRRSTLFSLRMICYSLWLVIAAQTIWGFTLWLKLP